MKVLVCGGRAYNDKEKVYSVLDNLNNNKKIYCIVQGGAKGADSIAAQWASDREVLCLTFKADWDLYGKAAGMHRNLKMLKETKPDMVVAFPGGKGTDNMVKIAYKYLVPYEVVE
jgi:hypothetical protein